MNDSYFSISSKYWSESTSYIKSNGKRMLPMAKRIFDALSDTSARIFQYRKKIKVRSKKKIDPEAQCKLAERYHFGIGVKPNPSKAFRGYERAAKAGHLGAKCNLGLCYYEGIGVAVNFAKAVHWYTEAAKVGNVTAQFNLGLCYLYGKGIERDREEALRWLKQAAEAGDVDAQEAMALYSGYMGEIRDLKEASKWYSLAAEGGSKRAKDWLQTI